MNEENRTAWKRDAGWGIAEIAEELEEDEKLISELIQELE